MGLLTKPYTTKACGGFLFQQSHLNTFFTYITFMYIHTPIFIYIYFNVIYRWDWWDWWDKALRHKSLRRPTYKIEVGLVGLLCNDLTFL